MDDALVDELEGFLQGVKQQLRVNLELRKGQLEEFKRIRGLKR